jgi:hypothetical protein
VGVARGGGGVRAGMVVGVGVGRLPGAGVGGTGAALGAGVGCPRWAGCPDGVVPAERPGDGVPAAGVGSGLAVGSAGPGDASGEVSGAAAAWLGPGRGAAAWREGAAPARWTAITPPSPTSATATIAATCERRSVKLQPEGGGRRGGTGAGGAGGRVEAWPAPAEPRSIGPATKGRPRQERGGGSPAASGRAREPSRELPPSRSVVSATGMLLSGQENGAARARSHAGTTLGPR